MRTNIIWKFFETAKGLDAAAAKQLTASNDAALGHGYFQICSFTVEQAGSCADGHELKPEEGRAVLAELRALEKNIGQLPYGLDWLKQVLVSRVEPATVSTNPPAVVTLPQASNAPADLSSLKGLTIKKSWSAIAQPDPVYEFHGSGEITDVRFRAGKLWVLTGPSAKIKSEYQGHAWRVWALNTET